MITVKLPDGSMAQFPDGTAPDIMKAAIQKRFPPTAAAATPSSTAAVASPQATGNGLVDTFNSVMDPINAATSSFVNAIPIAGPLLSNIGNNVDAAIGKAIGAQETTPEQIAALRQQEQASNPAASTIGAIGGAVAPILIGGAFPTVAKGLGMASDVPGLAGLGIRTLASGGSSAAIAGADTLARGGTPQQAAENAALGGVVGLVAPGIGDAVGTGLGVIGNRGRALIEGATNPDLAAQRVVAGAVNQDRSAAGLATNGPMTAADEAAAATNGQPLVNADRFGQNVRTLARTSANLDPTAEALLKDITEQRFLTQSDRARNFVQRVGAPTDDLAYQDQLLADAQRSNRSAYDRAYTAPGAQAIWSDDLAGMFHSPIFSDAVRGATATGANDAAISGMQAVRNPFTFDESGNAFLTRHEDGSVALPNLPFWDIVQRNLRSTAEQAARSGNNLRASQANQLRTRLLGMLDSSVPAFRSARQGAAAAFGAQDALDAGRRFVSQRMALPEARRAYARMTPAERKAFAVGFSSSLIDKINAASDRVNVVNQVFGSPAARQQVELALGQDAAKELEQFSRVENIMQMTRQAVSGNSSTAKQLAAMGTVGMVGGGMLGGWDLQHMAGGAGLMMVGRAGLRALGKAGDQRVMRRIAQMLTSDDPQQMRAAIQLAGRSQSAATAIRAIERGLQLSLQSAAGAVPARVNSQ